MVIIVVPKIFMIIYNAHISIMADVQGATITQDVAYNFKTTNAQFHYPRGAFLPSCLSWRYMQILSFVSYRVPILHPSLGQQPLRCYCLTAGQKSLGIVRFEPGLSRQESNEQHHTTASPHYE